MKIIAAAALALALSAPAFPGTLSYQCHIGQQLEGKDDGTLARPQKPWLEGARFAIDRQTGKIVGPEAGAWTFADSTFVVHARGNDSNSFVVVATAQAAGGGVHVTVIAVREYQPGKKKAFLATSGAGAYAGLCE